MDVNSDEAGLDEVDGRKEAEIGERVSEKAWGTALSTKALKLRRRSTMVSSWAVSLTIASTVFCGGTKQGSLGLKVDGEGKYTHEREP